MKKIKISTIILLGAITLCSCGGPSFKDKAKCMDYLKKEALANMEYAMNNMFDDMPNGILLIDASDNSIKSLDTNYVFDVKFDIDILSFEEDRIEYQVNYNYSWLEKYSNKDVWLTLMSREVAPKYGLDFDEIIPVTHYLDIERRFEITKDNKEQENFIFGHVHEYFDDMLHFYENEEDEEEPCIYNGYSFNHVK